RDVPLERLWKVFGSPARRLPEDIALVQADHAHLVGPGPARMRGNDLQLRELGREVVHRERVRSAQAPPEAARRTGAHARRADMEQLRHPELIDLLEQGPEPWIVDREV